jgi:hypothetical protein
MVSNVYLPGVLTRVNLLKNSIYYIVVCYMLLTLIAVKAGSQQISALRLQSSEVAAALPNQLPLIYLGPGINCVAALFANDKMGSINVINLEGEPIFRASIGPYANICGMLGSRSQKVWVRLEAPEESWDYKLYDIIENRLVADFWSKDFLWPSPGGVYFYSKPDVDGPHVPIVYDQNGKKIGVLPNDFGPRATYSTNDTSIWLLDGYILKEISIPALKPLREYTLTQFDEPEMNARLCASPDGTVFAAYNDSFTVIIDVVTGEQSKVTFPKATFLSIISLNENFILADSGRYFIHIHYLKETPYLDLYKKAFTGYDAVFTDTTFPGLSGPVWCPAQTWVSYETILIINYRCRGSKNGTCVKSALLELPIEDGQLPFMQAIDGLATIEYPLSLNRLVSFNPNKELVNGLNINIYSIIKE